MNSFEICLVQHPGMNIAEHFTKVERRAPWITHKDRRPDRKSER